MANNLICAKLREIVKLQNILPKNDLNYRSKRGKTYKLMVNMVNVMVNIHYLLLFKGIHEGYLSLENADLIKAFLLLN